eukprot:9822080-Lingulodinium_polyedra.AAC.1
MTTLCAFSKRPCRATPWLDTAFSQQPNRAAWAACAASGQLQLPRRPQRRPRRAACAKRPRRRAARRCPR